LSLENGNSHFNYLAPERISGSGELTNKVDIWALGCTLYYLIYKRDAISIDIDTQEIKEKILNFNLFSVNKKELFEKVASTSIQNTMMPIM
jgi:serine/threonine protein kinase